MKTGLRNPTYRLDSRFSHQQLYTYSFFCDDLTVGGSAVNWTIGDGTGGSEEGIGKVTSKYECIAKCFSRKKDGRLANGATIDTATHSRCYCEYGQTGRKSATKWQNTFIRPRK